MQFALFVLVNAALFLRPAEIVEEWKGLQIYEYLIVACLAASSLKIVRMAWENRFLRQPITLFVFAMLPAIVIAAVANGRLVDAGTYGFEFAKVLVYYVLLVAVVDSPNRLKQLLFWLVFFAAGMTALAVLDFNGVIDLPEVKKIVDMQEEDPLSLQTFDRLAGTGIFNDPNDICLLFTLTIPICFCFLLDSRMLAARVFSAAALGLTFYALYLTQSRGGLLAVAVGLFTMLWVRFGPKYAWGLSALGLPAAIILYAGRQTDFASATTALHRFELWQDAVTCVKTHPFFGIGPGQFEQLAGLVAHNSFLHCYAELGFIGGTIFLGAFLYALWALVRVNRNRDRLVDPEIRRFSPYLLAVVAGLSALMMSLSRSYIVPVYMVLGLVTVHLRFAVTRPYEHPLPLDGRFVKWLAFASIGFVAIMYLAMRVLVRYS